MQKIFRHIILSIIIFKSVVVIYSQDSLVNQPALRVIVRAYNDSIKLRWAPTDYHSWMHGIKYGYIIERTTLIKDTMLVRGARSKRITPQPLKPLSLKEWERYAEIDDYVAIAAEAIYGSEFNVQPQQTSPVISVFNIASEQQNRYSFAMFSADCSPLAAKLSALSYTDYDVRRGEKYVYRIYPAVDIKGYQDTATVFTGSDEYFPLPKPYIYNIVSDEKTITLEWPSDDEGRIYTAYEINRSDDNVKTFKNITPKPFINLRQEKIYTGTSFYVDTVKETGKRYVYRIRGITPFGEKGPYSDTVSAIPRQKIKSMPYIANYKYTANGVYIEWSFDREYEKLLKHFIVMRSSKSDEGYKDVSGELPATQREFTDTHPLPTAYYKVVGIDKDNMVISSFPYLVQSIDTIPPHVPRIAFVRVDTMGRVYVHWYRNTDEDIYGYRVYRANDINEEFSLITGLPVRDTFYVDTINLTTLSPVVYYRLMALDNRQNHSGLSEPYSVKRPDRIPPVAPVIKKIKSDENGICIEWIPSTSKDVKKHQILRREKEKNEWEVIYEIYDTTGIYCDKQVKAGIIYKYCVVAVDSSGLRSTGVREVAGKYTNDNSLIQLSCRVDRQERKIRLTWNLIENCEYYIYRSSGEEPLALYKKVTSNNYDDTQVTPDVNYKYMVKALTNNKILLSNVEEVRY